MVQLTADEITTREVLDWQGLHLLHWHTSSCSQKLRIVLALKGVDWTGHLVSLPKAENTSPWFMGINPRGLVPVLVHDGAVHVESNDLLYWLEDRYPHPPLIPAGREAEVKAALAAEDALHLNLRTLSFRFVFGRNGPTKTAEQMENYRSLGAATVGGEPDASKPKEVAYYARMAAEGITDEACRAAFASFREEYERLDSLFARQPHILGEPLSLLDIAWYVYTYRLTLGGYPFQRLHPNVAAWFDRLDARPAFRREVTLPPEMIPVHEAAKTRQRETGTTMAEVVGL
jgi:glutathione S-transferase